LRRPGGGLKEKGDVVVDSGILRGLDSGIIEVEVKREGKAGERGILK
jgi:hypothetical protein